MRIFRGDIEKITTSIVKIDYLLEETSDIDEKVNLLSLLNILIKNYNLLKKDTEKEIDSIEKMYEYDILNEVNTRINAYHITNFNNMVQNRDYLKDISNISLNRFYINASSILKKEEYTDEDMYKIISKYFIKHDPKGLEIFNKLILQESIIDGLGVENDGTRTFSTLALGDFIIIKNNHDFKTITTLIHEIKHLEETKRCRTNKELNQYNLCNNFKEVGASYQVKNFLEFLRKDSSFSDKVMASYSKNYYNMRFYLKSLRDLLEYNSFYDLSDDKNIFKLDFYANVLGEVMSDNLMSKKTSRKSKKAIFDIINNDKETLLNDYNIERINLTGEELKKTTEKQYQKNIG